MEAGSIPIFKIKKFFQKRSYTYEDILPDDILSDICLRVTGTKEYTVEWDESEYNKGRLLILEHGEITSYITISNEDRIAGRNSAFQSVPSAINRYILDDSPSKELCYYFHPGISGNFETDYFVFMYRLMSTASVRFLNSEDYINSDITAFSTVADIINAKETTRNRNSANKSTFITKGPENQTQIFGKTYGASKYETTIICLAIVNVSSEIVELYEVEEGGLTKLPAKSKEALESLGGIIIRSTNVEIERDEYENRNSLRSIKYTYNLLERIGDKQCAMCECPTQQIIQGAHVWPVANIKRLNHLTEDEKVNLAISGENGLWLCQNHHKLFDIHYLLINQDGRIMLRSDINDSDTEYILEITSRNIISKEVLSDGFIEMLNNRYANMPHVESNYI